jgi:lactoylglutathione lyase
MQLAKPRVDVGLNTNNLKLMLDFWRREVEAKFDHVLPLAPGMKQHRHDINGSVLKINDYKNPLPDRPLSGYKAVMIAREHLKLPLAHRDPDGNEVTLVPSGTFGIEQIGIRLAVRDLDAHRRFYGEALALEEVPYPLGAAFRAGETLILLEQTDEAATDASFDGKGWRYITFQVFKVDTEHARVLAKGGGEGFPPRTLGETARISMVRDPDGNWIELSQRASITGSLEPG